MPPKPKPKPSSSHSKHLTHFLCIPLVTQTSRPQLQSSLSRFRNDLVGSSNSNNNINTSNTSYPTSPPSSLGGGGTAPEATSARIPPKAIRPVGTIHLTLGVMSLVTPEKVQTAVDVLKGVDLRALLRSSNGNSSDNGNTSGSSGTDRPPDVGLTADTAGSDNVGELRVTLKGILSMSDPNRTSILYTAPVDPDGRLLRFCLGLREIFTAADLIVPDTRPLLLHATVLNTIYVPGIKRVSGGRSGRGRNSKERLMLDVRDILERYRDMEWMSDVRVEKVAICKMGARKVEGGEEADEEYVVESEIEMP
ncbi:kinase A anchor protein [Xylogone sp. PMI_703]|nr:kinase A anchor protein [Xylogone sp. PMI_703]